MAFRGVQHISMDAKGRLAIPARFRDALAADAQGQVVVTIDSESSCLAIYPLPEWEHIEQLIQAQPSQDPDVKRFKRLILGYATDIQIDASGRMLLPPSLRELGQLGKKLVLVGQVNKLELWSEDKWVAQRDNTLEQLSIQGSQVPEQMMGLPL
ncbi:MAG: division/cell wall cluster transcriptional repressor MraZ [Pseudomonadota bacterium]